MNHVGNWTDDQCRAGDLFGVGLNLDDKTPCLHDPAIECVNYNFHCYDKPDALNEYQNKCTLKLK